MTNDFRFYRENDFKETSAGKIPKGWTVRKVEELFDVETGTTPSTRRGEYWKDGSFNWITPTDLSKLNGKMRIESSERKITEKALKEANLSLLPKGSVIASTRAPVGYVAVLDEPAAFNQGCKGLIPRNPKEISPEFYCYYLLSKKQMLRNLSSGSTFKELSKDSLERFSIPYLSFEEQCEIVRVLGVVDLAVGKACEVIAKTERLKKGLMQVLLTRGIGHKEYKETEIGRIPKAWQVMKLEDALDLCQYGLSVPSTEGGRYPIVRMDELVNGYVSSEIAKSVDLNDKTFKAFKLEKEDILFNRTNSYELVGRTGIFQLEGDYVFASYLIRLRPKRDMLDPLFLTLCLIFSHDRLRQLATRAVHQANINATNLQKIRVPRPPLEEQRRIASILQTMDMKLDLEKKEKARLERIKRGLMDLLLTGKVRIKVD